MACYILAMGKVSVQGAMTTLRYAGEWRRCTECQDDVLVVAPRGHGTVLCEACAHFRVVREFVALSRWCYACRGMGCLPYGPVEACPECHGSGELSGPMSRAEYEHAL